MVQPTEAAPRLGSIRISAVKMKLHFCYRISMLILLGVLSACAFPAREKTANLPDSEREISENCALAKERQNRLAIGHWCREQAQGKRR